MLTRIVSGFFGGRRAGSFSGKAVHVIVYIVRDAVAVIRNRLLNDASLLAAVPSTKIMAGELPLNIVLPAIAVEEISASDHKTIAMDIAGVFKTSRIQVTVFAENYASQKSILRLVRTACANYRGSITALGVRVDSILPDSASPDIKLPGMDIYLQSRDFIVRYVEL